MLKHLAAAATLAICALCTAQPLTTAFTFQGELNNGAATASGTYDFRFALFDSATGGAQVGPLLCSDNIAVVNGKITVQLDFGAQFAGQQRFIEIQVRQDTGLSCGNSAGFVTLGPRQSLSATPNAVYSLSAASAATATNTTQLNGQPASFYTNANNLTGTLPPAALSGTYSSALTLTNVSNIFAGSGAGLTSLNATNLASGTLDPARLPVPLSLTGNAPISVLGATNSSTSSSTAAVLGRTTSSTGFTNGVLGQSDSTGGNGVYGIASATSGQAWGVYGITNSVNGLGGYFTGPGDGLWGVTNGVGKSGSLGFNFGGGDGYGVYGQTNGTTGAGVLGQVFTSTGTASGGFFVTNTDSGTGATGRANSPTGSTKGLYGESDSSSGTGVYGDAPSTTGNTFGGQFFTHSPNGLGVNARATATTGFNYGVYGESASDSGVALGGNATSASGFTYGGWFGATFSPNGTGVRGDAQLYGGYFNATGSNGIGAQGFGSLAGGQFESDSTSGMGCRGYVPASSGTTYGGYFECASTTGYGCYGRTTAGTGANTGVLGQTGSTGGIGVWGYASVGSGNNIGVLGQNSSTSGIGVKGLTTASSGPTYAGYFQSTSSSGTGVYAYGAAAGGQFETPAGVAVAGNATSTSGGSFGGYLVSASNSGQGAHCVATAGSGTTYGVVGETLSAGGYGVYSLGRFASTGAKAFRIDHPADPENKYLLHYCIESPEVLNAYSGKVTLNQQGEATIDLPPYFASINKDPRYTLTPIGAPMPLLHIAQEVDEVLLTQAAAAAPGDRIPSVSFTIAGGAPNAKVSWEVKALRNDRWVQKNGAPVEVEKAGPEKGTYQHPDLYNQPLEKGLSYRATPSNTPDAPKPSTPDAAPEPTSPHT